MNLQRLSTATGLIIDGLSTINEKKNKGYLHSGLTYACAGIGLILCIATAIGLLAFAIYQVLASEFSPVQAALIDSGIFLAISLTTGLIIRGRTNGV